MWVYIWFGLAIVEAVAILVLAAQVGRVLGQLSWQRKLAAIEQEQQNLMSDWLRAERAARVKQRSAFRAIIALDTPKAAHGVKKAVKIAREALNG